MDLKAITTLLTNQESTFRTILSTASPSISGDALRSKLTQHYIKLVLLARDSFPPSNDSLDDPFESLSHYDNPYSSLSSSSSRKRRDPPAQGQMEAIPVEKTTPRYASWYKAGGPTLFNKSGGAGKGDRSGGKGKRKSGQGVAVPIVDLCGFTDNDSASSLGDEEERRFYVRDISGLGLKGKGKKVLSREEKEEESIAYYEDGEDDAEVFNEVEKENANVKEHNGEGGEEGENPAKRRRCI